MAPSDEDLLSRAGEISYDGDVSLYDAVPIALAERQKTVCITADEQTVGEDWAPKVTQLSFSEISINGWMEIAESQVNQYV